jgi:hypothetical protein
MVRATRCTGRLDSLYRSERFGGEQTIRAKVIRELIDEIRLLRRQLAEIDVRPDRSEPP